MAEKFTQHPLAFHCQGVSTYTLGRGNEEERGWRANVDNLLCGSEFAIFANRKYDESV
jgi:hypothetical protein